jgi:hypothetical protein
MTSPKIGAPEVFLLSTAVTSMFACATYSRWTRSSRSKADVISIIRKAVPLTASLMLLISSPAFAARPHQTRADDLARPTYERQLIPARNHYSNPYIGLWVQGYPQPTRS